MKTKEIFKLVAYLFWGWLLIVGWSALEYRSPLVYKMINDISVGFVIGYFLFKLLKLDE